MPSLRFYGPRLCAVVVLAAVCVASLTGLAQIRPSPGKTRPRPDRGAQAIARTGHPGADQGDAVRGAKLVRGGRPGARGAAIARWPE